MNSLGNIVLVYIWILNIHQITTPRIHSPFSWYKSSDGILVSTGYGCTFLKDESLRLYSPSLGKTKSFTVQTYTNVRFKLFRPKKS